MKKPLSYFFPAFFTILLSVGIFLIFKQFLPKRLFGEVKVDTGQIIVDSLMLAALSDSIDTDTIPDMLPVELPETAQVDTFSLKNFFMKLFELENTKKGSVRVAYFGDSMIESDLIVQDIRKNYQETYGGRGVGFVPVTMTIPSSCITIRHEYSSNWQTYSLLAKSPKPVGVSGYVSIPADSTECWVKYRAGSLPLVNATLYYGKANNDNASISVTVNSNEPKTIELKPDNTLNSAYMASYANSLTINFSNADSIPFYGVDFAEKNGVYVDNFSSRGNSGLPLSTFGTGLMNAFQRRLGYDLIVLQYGTNVLSSKSYDYIWYQKRMTNTVKHLKNCFPEADILVISLADKATKYGTEMKTDSAIAPLIKAQKTYALNTESAFLNLFELMGGEGTMVDWVEQEEPALAAKDYTHFSIKGSKKIADLIFNKLEEQYTDFKEKNNLAIETEEQHPSIP